MSLHPHAPEPVPGETARVARVAFPAGAPSTRMRDRLANIYRLLRILGEAVELCERRWSGDP